MIEKWLSSLSNPFEPQYPEFFTSTVRLYAETKLNGVKSLNCESDDLGSFVRFAQQVPDAEIGFEEAWSRGLSFPEMVAEDSGALCRSLCVFAALNAHGNVTLQAVSPFVISCPHGGAWFQGGDFSLKSDRTGWDVVRSGENREELVLSSSRDTNSPQFVLARPLHAELGGQSISLISSPENSPDLSEDELSRWRDSHDEACNQHLSLSPHYVDWVARVLRTIIGVRSEGSGLVSGSSMDHPGEIYLSAGGDPIILAETLVHEASHQYLHIMNRLGPLDDGADLQLYYSPFRRMDRPIRAILVAYHAFANVWLFYQDCIDNTPTPARYLNLQKQVDQQLEAVLPFLTATNGLTPLGQSLWKPLSQRIEARKNGSWRPDQKP